MIIIPRRGTALQHSSRAAFPSSMYPSAELCWDPARILQGRTCERNDKMNYVVPDSSDRTRPSEQSAAVTSPEGYWACRLTQNVKYCELPFVAPPAHHLGSEKRHPSLPLSSRLLTSRAQVFRTRAAPLAPPAFPILSVCAAHS